MAQQPPKKGEITSPDPSRIDDPQHWRDRAGEARDIANAMGDTSAKMQMHQVAAKYDRLAEEAEDRNGRQTLGRSSSKLCKPQQPISER
jgi:hypothetical protein